MSTQSVTVLPHNDVTFEHATVLLTGHSFIDCHFVNCTLVFHGFPIVMTGCHFRECVWRFEFTIHDEIMASAFEADIWPLARKSLPRIDKSPTGGNGKN